jgi:hypothetical protein
LNRKDHGTNLSKNPKPIAALILCTRVVFKAFIGRRRRRRRRQQLVLSSKDNKQASKQVVPL